MNACPHCSARLLDRYATDGVVESDWECGTFELADHRRCDIHQSNRCLLRETGRELVKPFRPLIDRLLLSLHRKRALLDTVAQLEADRDEWRDLAVAGAELHTRAAQEVTRLNHQRHATRRQLAYLTQRFAGDARDARQLATAQQHDSNTAYWQGRAVGLDAAASLAAIALRRIDQDWSR